MKKSRLLGAVCACLVYSVPITTHAIGVNGQGTWETTLKARDLDGNTSTIEAYYDTVLNITWLADTKLIASNTFGLPYGTDLDVGHAADQRIFSDGTATFDGAFYWLKAMNEANYGGASQWRLPMMVDTGAPGCDFTTTGGTDCGWNVLTGTASTTVYSEMASMFYNTLGNLSVYTPGTGESPQPGWGLTNTGPFNNLQANSYWSGRAYIPSPSRAWYFDFNGGSQNRRTRSTSLYAWAVHSGDIGTAVVPIPSALYLFGSGLLGLVGIARRKKAA